MSDPPKTDLLKPDDPHYTAVGRVISTWAFLEALIDMTIADLIDSDARQIACLTAQMIGPAPRLSALIALLREHDLSKARVDEIESYAGRTQQLGNDRNRIAHDPLFGEEGSDKVYVARTSAKRSLVYTFDPVTMNEMTTLADRIDKSIEEFLELRAKVFAEKKEKSAPTPQHNAATQPLHSHPGENDT